jgi:CheY-like chemotaxis protein/nitrogen-specific signal transduction histidine kinase
VAFVLDLTERRHAAAEREARVAAEAANRAKSSFLASMSHELRTPLNGILGYAQLLQLDADLPDNKRRGLATIEASGHHLLALINDILDLARIEAGRLDLAADNVDLRRMLELVADTVRPMAQRKALRFEVEVGPGLPQAVQADERRLSQVLINVLGNAVKFTDRGAVTLRASHRPEDGGRARLTFEVKDTGVGMSAEELQRIFRAFEQGGAAARRADGSGLGLAITEALVRQMGGQIDVRSEPGQGSVFSVELTLPVLEDAAATTAEGPVAGYEGRRRTVLIADDVPENRAFLIDLLGSLGFCTLEAADGLQALASVRATRPDLILMDNGMPSLSGLEVTKRLRADPGLADVPIIAVSAGASGAERQRCLDAGANAFVPKPVDVPELLQAIGLQLGLQWMR